MLQLLSNNVIINSVDLNGITANINRNVKGTFNFDYLIKAFSAQKNLLHLEPLVIRLEK
jgi:hypothetical protein